MKKGPLAVLNTAPIAGHKTPVKYLFIGYNPPGHDFVVNELRSRGSEVLTIPELDIALEKLKAYRPDLIIYRAYFQRGTLEDTLNTLTKASHKIAATLVVMSPRATESDIKSMVKSGVSDFVLIPCEPKLIIRRLDYQLSRRKTFETEELVEKSKELTSSLKLISDVLRIVAAVPDAHRRLYECVKVIGEFTKSPRVNLVAGRANLDRGTILASSDSFEIKKSPINLAKYPEVKEVLLKGIIVHVADVKASKLTQQLQQQIRSIKVDSVVVLPIKYRGQLLGALHLRLLKSSSHLGLKHINAFYAAALALGSTVNEIVSQDSEK